MRTKYLFVISVLAVFVTVLASCEKMLPPAPDNDKILDGPVAGLNNAQTVQHLRGDEAFNGKVFTAETGLGPVFVAASCGSCHVADGKGHPFTTLTRFGQTDSTGNQYLSQGAPLLQTRALPGYSPEQLPNGATFTKLTPPIATGLGFLDLVSDADIIAMSDPNDTNADSVSGVPDWNSIPYYVTPRPNSITQGGKYICRFGKKASVYDLLQQTVNAFNQDIGITSVYDPLDSYSLQNIDPEISTSTIHDIVFYLQTLKAPVQRDQDDAEVQLGKNIFTTIGCASCHKPTLRTGYSPVEALSNKDFHPYTDLLLHDMGNGLDDGYTEGNAATNEWRTAPLWGLGLAPNSQGGHYFLLHDGSARSIEEAISKHGGEAGSRRVAFYALSQSDRAALLKFLNSL